ncbi:MAG: hypothetical protein AB7F59_14730 [Bdellovibrionales bacterium]
MQSRWNYFIRRLTKLFPLISATLLILLAYQNCGQTQMGQNQTQASDPLVYKIDVDPNERTDGTMDCFNPNVDSTTTVDVTSIFFPENGNAPEISVNWHACVDQLDGREIRAFFLKSSDETQTTFALSVIRQSFLNTPILVK